MGLGAKVLNALKPVHERRAEAKAAEEAKNPPKDKAVEQTDDNDDPYGFRKTRHIYGSDVHAAAGQLSGGMWASR
jgi:hypothetical protein